MSDKIKLILLEILLFISIIGLLFSSKFSMNNSTLIAIVDDNDKYSRYYISDYSTIYNEDGSTIIKLKTVKGEILFVNSNNCVIIEPNSEY